MTIIDWHNDDIHAQTDEQVQTIQRLFTYCGRLALVQARWTQPLKDENGSPRGMNAEYKDKYPGVVIIRL